MCFARNDGTNHSIPPEGCENLENSCRGGLEKEKTLQVSETCEVDYIYLHKSQRIARGGSDRQRIFLCFQYPICKIIVVGKVLYTCEVKKPVNALKNLISVSKKSSPSTKPLLYRKFKIENSLKLPTSGEKPPELPFNGLSSSVLRTRRKLSHYLLFLF